MADVLDFVSALLFTRGADVLFSEALNETTSCVASCLPSAAISDEPSLFSPFGLCSCWYSSVSHRSDPCAGAVGVEEAAAAAAAAAAASEAAASEAAAAADEGDEEEEEEEEEEQQQGEKEEEEDPGRSTGD